MKALLLAVGLGLITVLQAQDPPASGEDMTAVRLGRGRVGWRGRREA